MIAKIKSKLKTYSVVKKLYARWKNRHTFAKPFFFLNSSNNSNICCIVLAGYKDFLWDAVFQRLKLFVPGNIDVCLVSSGLFSNRLCEICQENNWSYISMKRNSVTLALNTAIRSFPYAQYIYKVDEDIFLTRNFFTKLYECYEQCEKDSEYFPAFVAPLIPVNGYGHLRILKKLALHEEYARQFEIPRYAAGPDRMIENSADVAKYLWVGGGGGGGV
jgi:hypothetical protein